MKPGSLVECVTLPSSEECKRIISLGAIYPQVGIIYTVRMVRRAFNNTCDLILLEEIDNSHLIPIIIGRIEPGFNLKYFRELLPPMEAEIKELLEQPELA